MVLGGPVLVAAGAGPAHAQVEGSNRASSRCRPHRAVQYEPEGSHAATHFSDSPELFDLAREALLRTDVTGVRLVASVDLDRVVGMQDLVPTNDADVILYAKRLNRSTYTRLRYPNLPFHHPW